MNDSKAHPLAAGQIEIWKKIVDVQQHFNDLELRIRNFALVVTGAFLGLGGYAIKDGGAIMVAGAEVSIAGIVVFLAIFPLGAFYFMDRLWYHRLLEGSVQAGKEVEAVLKDCGYKVELGSAISARSPFALWPTRKMMHSKRKMDLFYVMLAVPLLALSYFLAFGERNHMTLTPTEQATPATPAEPTAPTPPAETAGTASTSVREVVAPDSVNALQSLESRQDVSRTETPPTGAGKVK